MTINLSVLPIEDVAKVGVPQKCLLPQISPTNGFKCGTWMRCELQEEGTAEKKNCYVVCQIYQRKSLEPSAGYVYLDRAVTVGVDEQQYLQRLHGTVLSKLEPLKDVAVAEVDINIIINMNFFNKARRPNLLDIVKLHLQTYCLTNHCTVRSQELQRIGIMAIEVSAKAVKDECHCFSIMDETLILIADVHMYSQLPALKIFHTVGYETVLQQLDELVNRHKSARSFANSNALIIGPVGCGKTATIAYFVQKNYCNYFHISMETVLGQYPGEAEYKLRKIFASARTFVTLFKPKAPTVIHLEDLHLLCPAVKAGSKDAGNSLRLCAQLNSLLDIFNCLELDINCLATTSDAKLLHKSLLSPGRFQNEIIIDPPNNVTRRKLFQLLYNSCLFQQPLTEQILENIMTQTSGYVIADLTMIVRLAEQAILHKNLAELSTIISEILAKTKSASMCGADVAVIKPGAGFDIIGGMHALKDALKLNVLTGLRHAAAYKRFGLSLPKGILLYGPPGCAKTTVAKCLAAEGKMTFIATSGAEVYSPYVGCAEKFVTKLFDTARRHAPCLLFLDEIDTLVGCRSIGISTSDVQTRILSTLLTEMDGIVQTRFAGEAYILVVAATNRPHMIDDALLRPGRFDQLIHVPAPDFDSRLSILEQRKQHLPLASNCNLLEIAEKTQNFSGADVCNLCNEAAMHALLRDMNVTEITKADFESVLRTQKPSLSQKQIDLYFQFQKGRLR